MVADGLSSLGDAGFAVHSKARPWRGTMREVDRAARAFAASLLGRRRPRPHRRVPRPGVVNPVADELAIRRTLAAYCQLCDDGYFAELAVQFAPDGTFAIG